MIKLSLENFYQLRISVAENVPLCAFYLYKDGNVYEKRKYSSHLGTTFNLQDPGMYKVKIYKKYSDGSIKSTFSSSLRFDGFREKPINKNNKDIVIVGISRTAAFAAHVFEVRHKIRYFLDPTGEHVGGTFFGRSIRATVSNEDEYRIVGHERHLENYPTLEAFSLLSGGEDVLTRELHRHGAMDLYRISRRTYLAGLIEGSYCIQNFIFNKYNCRIPFKAQIGEGTRLGIGGIGTVIHPDSVIGKNCVIAQNVTLGSRAGGNGTPVLGDNVWISPGAKCFGGRIGNNVIVGANAVVLKEIEDNSVVAGVPAKVINTTGEKYLGYFKKMNKD